MVPPVSTFSLLLLVKEYYHTRELKRLYSLFTSKFSKWAFSSIPTYFLNILICPKYHQTQGSILNKTVCANACKYISWDPLLLPHPHPPPVGKAQQDLGGKPKFWEKAECSENGFGKPDHPEKLEERCEINQVSFGEDNGKVLQLGIINFQKNKNHNMWEQYNKYNFQNNDTRVMIAHIVISIITLPL